MITIIIIVVVVVYLTAVSYGDGIQESSTKRENSKCVLIELVAGIFALGSVIYFQSVQFYIYDRISETKLINASIKANVCHATYKNSSVEKIETEIQTEASTVLMAIIFASSFPAIFPTVYFGTLTAKYGRKLAIRCSLIGFVIKMIVYLVVCYWKVSVYYLVIGNAIEGMLGAYGAALVAIFGMVADVTPESHSRSFRMTTVTAVLSMATAVANGVSGVLIESVGYVVIGVIVTLLALVNLFYIECFLPETFTSSAASSTFVESFKRSFSFYFRDTKDKRRLKLLLCLLAFFLLVGFLLVNFTTLTLFLLNKPFCWSKVHITVFGALRQLINWVAILVFTRIFRHLLPDVGMMLIALVSGAASQIMMAFANVDGLVYGGKSFLVVLLYTQFRVYIHIYEGPRCSSVVRAFAHGAMGGRIDPSFLVPASAPRLVYQKPWYVLLLPKGEKALSTGFELKDLLNTILSVG